MICASVSLAAVVVMRLWAVAVRMPGTRNWLWLLALITLWWKVSYHTAMASALMLVAHSTTGSDATRIRRSQVAYGAAMPCVLETRQP